MIGVTAASGQLGKLVVAQLVAAGAADRTVAIVRDPAKMAGSGVTVRAGDYGDVAGLTAALAGVDRLLLISGSELGQRAAQHANVITAAKAAGVRHVVYTSLLRADSSTIQPLAEEHAATEALLKASGLDYTILRNGWYTENFTGQIGGVLAGGGVIGSSGQGRIASATRADYAAAAVAVLTGSDHVGKTYELAGDAAWTLAEYAAEIARQTGRDIAYHDLPQAVYAEKLKGFGLPADFADLLAAWEVEFSKGALESSDHTLSALIGRKTTPMAETVAAALAAQ
ncbi:SDR family oxidoreductase [Frigidibacter sp. MR17.14]|uniref:SDR family oxidoreductase n=1 Tax=Frigidibacter sp. MR17.14 TaxID=3126509 RepID=UPI0030130D2A